MKFSRKEEGADATTTKISHLYYSERKSRLCERSVNDSMSYLTADQTNRNSNGPTVGARSIALLAQGAR